jgi:hypothetical protein
MSSIYICPHCGLETQSTTGMACHCILKHHITEKHAEREVLVDIVVKLIDDLSMGFAEKDQTGINLKELVICSGKCDNCFTSLSAKLKESGHPALSDREPRKLLYPHYPAVALQGLYCLRSSNGCWYLRGENSKWLHNPFRSKDGYWYEAHHRVKVNKHHSSPEIQIPGEDKK